MKQTPILQARRLTRAGAIVHTKGPAMEWVTFDTKGGGVLKVQAQHVVAIYNELGEVKLATSAGGVHTLSDGMSVAQAAILVGDTQDD